MNAEFIIFDCHAELIPGVHTTRAFSRAAFPSGETCEEILAPLLNEIASCAVGAVLSASPFGHFMGASIASALNRKGMKSACKSAVSRVQDGTASLAPGFTIEPGERLAIVNENLIDNEQILPLVRLVRAHGAIPVVICVILDRRDGYEDVEGAKVKSILSLRKSTFSRETCSDCRRGVPLEYIPIG